MPKTAAIYTLGCKVNQYESAAIGDLFRQAGYEMVDFEQQADVYVINTCTVTHLGDRKSRQMIRRAAKQNAQAVIAVTGCYAQTSPGEVLEIPGVDLVVGTKDKANIVKLVEAFAKGKGPVKAVDDIMDSHSYEELPVPIEQGKTRAFLKIQEGCNSFCAYCIIPYARGPVRSRLPENVLTSATQLIEQGFKEIVLTGIHIGAYGQDFADEQIDLAWLVDRLAKLPGLLRLRLGSIEPHDINDALIKAVASNPNICRHLHIPLQSGDDEVLASMRRRYNIAQFESLVNNIYQAIPGVALTTDVIVGFPGETEGQFQNTLQTVERVGFASLHVFKYSPRKGTPAAAMPDQVSPHVKEERSKRLIELGDKLANKFARKQLGQDLEVLVEQPHEGDNRLFEGHTDTYLKVIFPAEEKLRGQLVRVHIDEIFGQYLKGRII
ncbi:tRNA (N(6)-L-threonylcarbamoyladenosine(37)-C(2))-methylthiotransferase MtaB [Desulforamulus ferrireducens]|uniref:Threonylcarbamoyladenosine tRNA methylthiotransferase MtaB n=1 Tax=Desulforamulus ferrireducens TaxID=1833852 RepID=A0A1S6IYQ4_9FIRM|nr:tRNA (N(6)-L-threonylcarbamoyladenosine(37)-C(2))-methylthiotransferase MtaB [Desulforamulus ferrireducens]AQS59907.1 tRNA (N(6)-L-threonylcarbamoyladenosine(37)-C(2))-methylthiotransferase MtaB [Desulforamulus ferrireducens]